MVNLFAGMRPQLAILGQGWWCIKVFNFKQAVGMAFSDLQSDVELTK